MNVQYPQSAGDIEDWGSYGLVGRASSLSEAERLCQPISGVYLILPAAKVRGATQWKVLWRPHDFDKVAIDNWTDPDAT